MNKNNKATLTIHFMDGTTESYEFEPLSAHRSQTTGRILPFPEGIQGGRPN
jgi:hypothetical protein